MSNIYMYLLFLFIPFSVMAESGERCQGDMTIHSNMVLCIQGDTEKIEQKIKNDINKKGSDYDLNIDFYSLQRKYISEKCGIYNMLGGGGQRAELLENQCELDGVSDLYKFIKIYMTAVDNN